MKDAISMTGHKLGWPKVESDPALYWRERMLLVGYLIGVILGGVAMVAVSLVVHLRDQQLVTALLGVMGFLWALAVLVSGGRLSYRVRSLGAILAVFAGALAFVMGCFRKCRCVSHSRHRD